MYSSPSLKSKICTLTALWCLFFLSGAFLIFLTLRFYTTEESARDASLLAGQIDSILDEASKSATDALVLLSESTEICSGQMVNGLSNIAARHPHIRSVNLLHNGIIYCTSMPDNQGHEVGTVYSSRPLFMREIASTPGNPVISLTRVQGRATVMVSVDTFFIRNALKLSNANGQWMFRIGGHFFTGENAALRKWNDENNTLPGIRSSAYDYSLWVKEDKDLATLRFMLGTPTLLLFITVLALLLATGTREIIIRQNSIAARLKAAIKRGDIFPVYQPVVDSVDYGIRGYEVLARWKISEGNYISPDIFIPQAEASGLLIPLTTSLMQQAGKELPLLSAFSGREEYRLAFNFSYSYCLSEQFVADCMRFALLARQMNVQLVIEITEREKIEPIPAFISNLTRLRKAGCLLALDDFGTGYSGISFMTFFTPDYIKLDKIFVAQIVENRHRSELTDSIIDMAKRLGISIIAEGVETHTQAMYLKSRGVDFLQGYYFYKPLTAGELQVKI